MTRMKGVIAVTALMLLAACSGNDKMASVDSAQYQQLSQVQWTQMTYAPTAAQVNNNGLIMMR